MKWIKLIVEIIIGIGLIFWSIRLIATTEPTRTAQNKKKSATPSVAVASAELQKLEDTLICLGTVTARESVDITAQVTEKITALFFDDGDRVKKGAILVQLNNEHETATLRVAELAIEEHAREHERLAWLLKEDAIAQKDLDDRQTRLAMAKAEKNKAIADLNDRVIKAPFDGVLGLRLVSVGDLVTPGTKITSLDDIDTVYIDFPAPEKYAAKLSKDQPFTAVNVAYPETVFHGKIRTIESRVNAQTRSLQVRGMVENREHHLKPGMLLTVSLETGAEATCVVPELSIMSLGERQYVFLFNPATKTVKRTEIKIGRRVGGWVEVVEGLATNALLVTEGIGKITDGQRVSLTPSTPPPAASKHPVKP